MTASTIFLLLVLACPLMMMLMMRGYSHGGGDGVHGGCHGTHDHEPETREASTDELRHRRDELELLIEEREHESAYDVTPF